MSPMSHLLSAIPKASGKDRLAPLLYVAASQSFASAKEDEKKRQETREERAEAYSCLVPSLSGGSDRTDKDGQVHHDRVSPFMRRLLDTDPPLVVRQVRKGGDLVRVVSDPGGPFEQGDVVLETMLHAKVFDVGKHLGLGQVCEDADGLFRRLRVLFVHDGLVLGVFGVKRLLVFHHGEGQSVRRCCNVKCNCKVILCK
jgi:hypothetical protein